MSAPNSSTQRKRVLVTQPIAAEELARLQARADLEVTVLTREEAADRSRLLAAAAGCSGVLSLLTERMDDELMAAAGPELRVIANMAVGYDNVDVAAASRRGVVVTNTPGVLDEATADLALALLLAVARRVVEGDRLVRSGGFSGWRADLLVGHDLRDRTLGIVGMGRIGSAVARRASLGFGMKLRYVAQSEGKSREVAAELGAFRVALDELLRESDFVSVHLPLDESTHHLIDERALRSMRPTAILVNTSRGAVIDERALVRALREGWIAGAGLDVYEHEPELAPGLAELDNVVLLPHLGSATAETRQRMARVAVRNLLAVLAGERPPNAVNPEVL